MKKKNNLDLTKVLNRNPHITKRITLLKEKGCNNKQYLKNILTDFCIKNNHELVEENQFAKHLKRKYRFDYSIPELLLAVEYEGIHSDKSRHTTISGYTNDSTKYNLAALLGWTVLRYTSATIKNLSKDLDILINHKHF